MQNFEEIRNHIANDFDLTMQESYLICVELSLDNGQRHQSIYLSELQDDDDRNYLRVSTVIAEIANIDARKALRFNWDNRVGYLALRDLDGVPYLQLCENRPYDSLNPAELGRLVLEIGGMGDRMERELSSQGDLL